MSKQSQLFRINRETFSFSNPHEATILHMNFTLDFNYYDKSVLATNVVQIQKLSPDIEYACLDTYDLNIVSVRNCKHMTENMEHYLTAPDEMYGQGLVVKLPKEDICSFVIKYVISPKSPGLKWQLRNKNDYLIHSSFYYTFCRSVLPCHDAPGVRCPYIGQLIVPNNQLVLMSSILREIIQINNDYISYKFEQSIPVSTSYISFVIGQFSYMDISPTTVVWYEENTKVEKPLIENLKKIPQILEAMKKIAGPYVWGICDIFIMKDITRCYPGLNWISQEADLSNIVNIVVRNWFGAMISIESYKDIWLNEAYTKFMERKILEILLDEFGNPINQIWQNGLNELNGRLDKIMKQYEGVRIEDNITEVSITLKSSDDGHKINGDDKKSEMKINDISVLRKKEENMIQSIEKSETLFITQENTLETCKLKTYPLYEDTKLVQDLISFNPNRNIPEIRSTLSEKGAILFHTIEDIVGVIEFQLFLRFTIEKYKYETINTKIWIACMNDYFLNSKLLGFNFDLWLNTNGNVPVTPVYMEEDEKAIELMADVIAMNQADDETLTKNDFKQLSLKQLKHFLRLLLKKKLTHSMMETVSNLIDVHKYEDKEFQQIWLKLCVQNKYYQENADS